MKKTLLMMAAGAFLSVNVYAADADLYLRGAINGWGSGADYKFETADGENYTLHLDELNGEFKISTDDWSVYSFGGNGKTTIEAGKAYKLINSNASANLVTSAAWSDVTLDFALSTATLTVTVGSESETVVTYGIHGNFTDKNWSTTVLEETSPGVFSGKVTASLNNGKGQFGINKLENGIQTSWLAGKSVQTITDENLSCTVVEGGSVNVAYELTEGQTYNVSFTLATGEVAFAAEGGDVPTPPTPPVTTGSYDLWGTFSGDWGEVKLAADDNGILKGTLIPLVESGEFGVRELDANNEQVGWYNAAQGTVLSEENTSIALITTGVNIPFSLVANREYDITLNTATMELSIEWNSEEEPVVRYPEHLYIIGNLCEWNPSAGVELANEGEGLYTASQIEMPGETSYFSFCTQLGQDASDWNVGQRYGASEDGADVMENNTIVAGSNAFTVAGGTYNVTVNLADKTVTLTACSTDGISTVASEEGNAVYFNLQGTRVANPENGIFVKVSGGKAVKIVR